MAVNIPPDDCTCEHLCPDVSGCITIYVEEKSECWLLCPGSDGASIPDTRLPLDAGINVQAVDVELVVLAEFLDSHCDMPLFVPAADAHKKVSLNMRDTTLGAVIAQIGLMVDTPTTVDPNEGATKYLVTGTSTASSVAVDDFDPASCPQCHPTLIVLENGHVVAYTLTSCDGGVCSYESGPGGVV